MGTKTVDETGADTGAEARNDDESVKGTDVIKEDAAQTEAAAEAGRSVEADDSDEAGEFDEEFPRPPRRRRRASDRVPPASCPWCWASSR